VTWLCSAATVDHDGTIRIEDAKLTSTQMQEFGFINLHDIMTSAQMQELGLHDDIYHRTTRSMRAALGSALDAAFTIGGQQGPSKARAAKGKKQSPAMIDKLVEWHEMHHLPSFKPTNAVSLCR